MNGFLCRVLLLGVLAGCLFYGSDESFAQPMNDPRTSTFYQELDSALAYIKLARSDLALRTDYVERDSFRLDVVDRVMLDPLAMEPLLAGISAGLFDSLAGANPLHFQVIGPPADLFSREPLRLTGTVPFFPAETDSIWEHSEFPREIKKARRKMTDAAAGVIAALSRGGQLQATSYYELVAPNLTGADSVFLVDTLPELLKEDAEAEFYPPRKIDSLQRVSERWAARTTNLSAEIHWRALPDTLLNTAYTLIAAGVAAMEWEEKSRSEKNQEMRRMEVETDLGIFAFGSTGPDQYRGEYRFIYDPGGDDLYDLAPLRPGQHQYIFDLSGNDTYFVRDGRGLAAGLFSFGFLFDAAGDDAYRAGNFALGSGFFGGGLLVDLRGNDVYISDTFGQGAGAFGLGMLFDGAGTDQYSSALYAQGFGFAAGVGMLADQSGNDTYFAGGKYKDILRYTDHYISLSQGFSYGVRPDFSGGAGLLLDGAGNDVYTCDIFGQGCSYWWAFGGLYDGGGNDTYNCFQYGQGSATHMSAGILYDISGNDIYYGKGLMQGCGHDRATGWMLDLAGNDTYTAWDLSQGAGSANGTGLLIDLLGEDRYYVMRTHNTQGYGNPRRDFGSVGVFLDLSGADRYDGNGENESIWIIESKWGVGVDKNSDTTKVEDQ